MIRDAQLLVPRPLIYQLRILAELDGFDCAETAAEMILRKALDARPELERIAKAEQKAREKAREDILAELKCASATHAQ